MNMSVRLYWQHDLDLLALHESPGSPSFSTICKEALTAYVRNTPYTIFVPDKVYFKKYVDSKSFVIVLSPETEQDLIDFLDSVEYGFRCNVLKQIVRGYMEHSFIAPYFIKSTIKVKSRVHRNKVKNDSSASKTKDKNRNSNSTKKQISDKETKIPVQEVPKKESMKADEMSRPFNNPQNLSEEFEDPLAEFLVDEEPLEVPMEYEEEPSTDVSDEKQNSSFNLFGEMAKLMNN